MSDDKEAYKVLSIEDMMEVFYDADRITQRAVAIARAEPFNKWGLDDEEERNFARLVIHEDGKTATLLWPRATSDCDSYSLETEEVEFPAGLLMLTDEDLTVWQNAAKAKKEEAEKKRRADAVRRDREAAAARVAAAVQNGIVLDGKRYKLIADE